MRPEEFRRHGIALRDRIAREVDTADRLEMMFRTHRRGRALEWAAAAAVVIAVLLGALLLLGVEEAPIVATPPSTVPQTITELQALPVEVYLVLTDYSVNSDASCQGSGALTGIGNGSTVYLYDGTLAVPERGTPISLPVGEEVLADDSRARFLLSADDPSACVFALPDPGLRIDDYEGIGLFPESGPAAGHSQDLRGQRVIYRFGEPSGGLGDGGFEALDGNAPEETYLIQAELDSLRDSAGSGRIVGFIHLAGEHNSGPPQSPTQPVCTGAGRFDHVHPAQSVTVVDESLEIIGVDILRGSTYDRLIGCTLWFGVDVPPDLNVYLLHIAGRPSITLQRSLLDESGWWVNLWSNPDTMTANCVQVESVDPMTCILLEETQ